MERQLDEPVVVFGQELMRRIGPGERTVQRGQPAGIPVRRTVADSLPVRRTHEVGEPRLMPRIVRVEAVPQRLRKLRVGRHLRAQESERAQRDQYVSLGVRVLRALMAEKERPADGGDPVEIDHSLGRRRGLTQQGQRIAHRVLPAQRRGIAGVLSCYETGDHSILKLSHPSLH